MCVFQILPNLEKHPPFPQLSSKLSEFFFVKDLTNRVVCLQDPSIGEHPFLARISLFHFWSLFWPPLISGSTLVSSQSFLYTVCPRFTQVLLHNTSFTDFPSICSQNLQWRFCLWLNLIICIYFPDPFLTHLQPANLGSILYYYFICIKFVFGHTFESTLSSLQIYRVSPLITSSGTIKKSVSTNWIYVRNST